MILWLRFRWVRVYDRPMIYGDVKCVQKPTKSRLSLTHHANKTSTAVEQTKTLSCQVVRWSIRSGRWGQSLWLKRLSKSQVLRREWKTEGVREIESGDDEDDELPCVIRGESKGDHRDRGRLVPQLLGWVTNNVLVSPNFLALVFEKQEFSQQVLIRMQDLASEFSKIFPG